MDTLDGGVEGTELSVEDVRSYLEAAALGKLRREISAEELYAHVIQYLTYVGESSVLAEWVRATLLAEGSLQPPHEGEPTVSVIIPCHNYGHFLRECVESVLRQSFTAWEMIIINDGSTDNTAQVVDGLIHDFPKYRIRAIEQPCAGLVNVRNRGVSLAKGEFILTLDADDQIAPEFLRSTLALLRTKPELGYAGTKALFFGCKNEIWPRDPFVPLALFVKNQQGNTTLYRKTMWRDVGGYNPILKYGYEDWEFWIHATKKGWRGERVEEPYYLYRRKPDSMLIDSQKKDVLIKTQIVKLHPDVYEAKRLPRVVGEMANPNWIPPDLVISRLWNKEYSREY